MIYTTKVITLLNNVANIYMKNDIRTKEGLNSIFHIYEVTRNMKTESETVVAILHDFIEDFGADNLSAVVDISTLDIEEIRSILDLTHNKKETYEQYIKKISQNKLATKVKIADLKHNLNILRLPEEDRDKFMCLMKRYQKSLDFLTAQQDT